MPKLEQIQQNFVDAIFDPHISLDDFIGSSHPFERLDVYRTTIFENLRNSLELTFPGIWKLLGDECANSAAYIFAKNPGNMPNTGCLDDWGEAFPLFLASQSAFVQLPYLKDYAIYEWLMHLAFIAADSSTLSPQDLEKIPEDKIDNIRFNFLPSVFLYEAEFPIYRIQEIIEDPNAPAIDLQPEETIVVISRPHKQVMSLFVTPATGLFLKSLMANETLLEAATQTEKKYRDFDLSAAIGLLLKHELIQEIQL